MSSLRKTFVWLQFIDVSVSMNLQHAIYINCQHVVMLRGNFVVPFKDVFVIEV